MTMGDRRISASLVTVELLPKGPGTGLVLTHQEGPLSVTGLEASGLVQTEKSGRVRTCNIKPAGLSVVEQWIADRRSLWERRLDRLGDLLAEPDDIG